MRLTLETSIIQSSLMAKLCGYYQTMTSFSEDGKYPKDVLKCFFYVYHQIDMSFIT